MVKVSINNKEYEVSKDISVLQACNELNIHIPTLCYDERLKPEGKCNLCIVEVDGEPEFKTSCNLKVKDGMKIRTNTSEIINARREVLEKLVWGHPEECTDCRKTSDCKLRSYSSEYEVARRASTSHNKISYPIDDSNLFYDIDPNKCISCNLCIKVCDELQGRSSLEVNEQGYVSHKSQYDDASLPCNDCGNCVSVCPTGALSPKSYMMEVGQMEDIETKEVKKVKTTCSYCGVGCQLELSVEGNHVVDVKAVNVLPNTGLLCVKGKFGFRFINHPDRLKTPLIRKNVELVESTWEEAYDLIINKAKELKSEYGGDVFGGLSSARCTNEENYLFQKLFRAGFGTNNIDHCARL